MKVPSTNEANVESAEKALGVRLPREFRERLMAMNGGELTTGGDDWKVFPVLDATQPQPVAPGDLVAEAKRAAALPGYPKGAIAIAVNKAGDLLVLLPATLPRRLDPQVQKWSLETQKCKPVALRYDDK